MMNSEFNMSEEWVKLKENEIPKGDRYAITKIIDDEEGTKIFLDNEVFAVEIFFDGMPLLIKIADEDVRMRTWGDVQERCGDKYIFRYHFFFEVKNSKLTEWVKEEGCGFYDDFFTITHYCIVADGGFIDIVATFEPKVTVSKMEKAKHESDKTPSENKQSYALIDFTDAKNIYDVHERISGALEFPGWYEKNLEALWEMLKRYEKPLEIRLKGVDAIGENLTSKVKRIVETFKEAEAKFGYISVVLV